MCDVGSNTVNADIEDEFTAYVSARSPALLRTAYLLTGNERDAEDLLQTALLKTLRHWRRIRAHESLDGFVRTVMVNERRAWLRRKASTETPVATLPEPAGRGEYGQVDDLDRLHRALRMLPRRQRAAVVLRFYEDLSEADTAAALDCSVGTVKSLTSRGAARLRQLLLDSDRRDEHDHLPRR